MEKQRRLTAGTAAALDAFKTSKRHTALTMQATGTTPVAYEHYKFDEQESSIHLEWRAQRGPAQLRMMRIVTEVFVYLLGLGLGVLVGSMTMASRVANAPSLPWPCPRTPAIFALPSPPSPTLSPTLRRCTMWSCTPRTWHCTQMAPRGRLTWVLPSPPTRGSTC